MSEPIDIGHGVTIAFVVHEEKIVGLVEEHAGKDGQPCSGYCAFRGTHIDTTGGPSWAVEMKEPLTLSPSILCTTCGHHGFIRDGKWVPA